MVRDNIKRINWKKIISVFIFILFIISIFYLIHIYRTIQHSKITHFAESENVILNETNITSIDKVYQFQAEDSYHIAFGRDDKEKEWIVFVPMKRKVTKTDLVLLESDKVLSQEQIEATWQKQCEGCTLTGSSPAMIKKKPLWELTYNDASNRYVIEYISLQDGSIYEQIRLLRKYNTKG